MTDITTIPVEELKKDLRDSLYDIAICKTALNFNIVDYSGGSVQDRIDTNQRIADAIEAELARRDKEQK